MFELFITMLVPHRRDREGFFDGAELLDRKRVKIGDSSLTWFKLIYLRVYQLPVVFVVLTIAAEALAGANCPDNHVYKTVDILVSVVSGVSTFMAILGLLMLVRRFKNEYKGRGVVAKFAVLKGLVGLTTTQKFIIGVLYNTGAIDGSNKTSHYDLTVGLPDMLINVEMLLAALGFLWAYNWTPYTKKNMALQPRSEKPQHMSTVKFVFEGLYFPALFIGIYQAAKYGLELLANRRRQQRGTHQSSQQWPSGGPQRGGHASPEYTKLTADHSPRRSPERYELSQSRPQYSIQTQGGSNSLGPHQYYPYEQRNASDPPKMPVQTQPS